MHTIAKILVFVVYAFGAYCIVLAYLPADLRFKVGGATIAFIIGFWGLFGSK